MDLKLLFSVLLGERMISFSSSSFKNECSSFPYVWDELIVSLADAFDNNEGDWKEFIFISKFVEFNFNFNKFSILFGNLEG